jgi:hypothetical protein
MQGKNTDSEVSLSGSKPAAARPGPASPVDSGPCLLGGSDFQLGQSW